MSGIRLGELYASTGSSNATSPPSPPSPYLGYNGYSGISSSAKVKSPVNILVDSVVDSSSKLPKGSLPKGSLPKGLILSFNCEANLSIGGASNVCEVEPIYSISNSNGKRQLLFKWN